MTSMGKPERSTPAIERQRLRQASRLALAFGLVTAFLSTGIWFFLRDGFFQAYLVAFMLCFGMTVPPVGLWLLAQLTGGAWGGEMSAYMRAAAKLVPFLALLFLPLLFGLNELYPWQRSPFDPHYLEKRWYLNLPGFLLRAILAFGVWAYFARVLERCGRTTQTAGQGLSGLGIILFILTITIVAVDWLMSLTPRFYSTIYGLLVLAGQMASSFAWAIILVGFFPGLLPPTTRSLPAVAHDLGNFLLMSVMFWAYISFSQLLLIWSGQLPEEIAFYNLRFSSGWQWVGIGLLVLHFFLPFFLLLSRRLKRRVQSLVAIAMVVLLARWLDMVWLVQPSFHPSFGPSTWLMVLIPLSLGALWFGALLGGLERARYG